MSKEIIPIQTVEEKNQEQDRLDEINILLEQLFQREEATAKRIIECLYDIAIVNIINQKIRFSLLNALLKYLLKFPKPLAKVLGLKLYIQPKCPQLITDWLFSLVEFKPKEEETIKIEASSFEQEILPEMKKNRQELKLLRQKVRLLTGSLILVIVLFSGNLLIQEQIIPLENLPFSQSKIDN